MSLAKDISRGGVSAGTAQAINGSVASAVTAAGSVITDATDLTATVNVVTTVSSGQGVQLYSMMVGDTMEVYNATSTTLKVYPDSSSVAINQLTAGTAHNLPQFTGATYRRVSSTQIWANLSA